VEQRLKLLLAELAREGLKEKPDPDAERRTSQAARDLQDRHGSYYERYAFSPGDIVKWKPFLNNRRFPSKDGVAIVTRVLPAPVYDMQKKDAGNPLFMEPLTLALGVFDSDDDFAEFHYDGSRFMPAQPQDAAPRVVQRLRECFEALNTRVQFKRGDMVVWKPGLKNKKRPKLDEAAVVVDVLDPPVFDAKKGAGAQYFMEPLDLKLGVIDEDGDWIVYHFDSRRFTHAPV